MLNIKTDSRKIKNGDIFLALSDLVNDGHKYVDSAIKNGAKTLVVSQDITINDPTITIIRVEDTRVYLNSYLKDHYGKYLEEMTFIGVTGTNGKTSTCYMLASALNFLGTPCAYLGTSGFYLGEKVRDTANTTPDTCELYEYLLEAYEKGFLTISMEASSHGLALGRLGNFRFDYAGFTNLTQAHMEFHKDKEDYALAKQKLFKLLKPEGVAIVNADDPEHGYFLLEENQNRTFGFQGQDYMILDYQVDYEGSHFQYEHQGQSHNLRCHLFGQYNISNVMLLTAFLHEMGYEQKRIESAVAQLRLPIGRMTLIPWGKKRVFIDYAHTTDGIEKVLTAAKEILEENASIFTIFCCTGTRDRIMRPQMAEYAAAHSKLAIMSSDHTYGEPKESIIEDAMINLKDAEHVHVIWDRNEAITYAMSRMVDGDILLILGKGDEKYNNYGDEKVPVDDFAKVKEIINKGDTNE